MSIATLQKDKLAKTVPHKEEILDFILYIRVLGNSVACN